MPQRQCVEEGKPREPEIAFMQHFLRLLGEVGAGLFGGMRMPPAAICRLFEPLRQRDLAGKTEAFPAGLAVLRVDGIEPALQQAAGARPRLI